MIDFSTCYGNFDKENDDDPPSRMLEPFFKPNFAREYGRFSLATVHVHVNPSLPIEQEPPIGFHCPKRHVCKTVCHETQRDPCLLPI